MLDEQLSSDKLVVLCSMFDILFKTKKRVLEFGEHIRVEVCLIFSVRAITELNIYEFQALAKLATLTTEAVDGWWVSDFVKWKGKGRVWCVYEVSHWKRSFLFVGCAARGPSSWWKGLKFQTRLLALIAHVCVRDFFQWDELLTFFDSTPRGRRSQFNFTLLICGLKKLVKLNFKAI